MDTILCGMSCAALFLITLYFMRLSRSARDFPELRSDTHRQVDIAFPKVSVILAVKDEENHVEGCVRSLFSLSYPHLEVVIVNDRSSDRTTERLATRSESTKVRAQKPRKDERAR